MRDKVTRQCPQTTTFDSNRGPSAYQPNALPLGQTGSLSNQHYSSFKPKSAAPHLSLSLSLSLSLFNQHHSSSAPQSVLQLHHTPGSHGKSGLFCNVNKDYGPARQKVNPARTSARGSVGLPSVTAGRLEERRRLKAPK